jgi:sugar lactone lactonase YvrE
VIEHVDGVVDADFEVLAVGFGLAEAPVADPGDAIWVSDAVRGGVHRIAPGAPATHVSGRRGIGGLVRHASGALLAAGRDISVVDEHGAHTVVSEPGAAGFNDLGAGPDGLAVDEAGGVVVALGTGAAFARIRPDGTTDRIHAVPAGFVSSVCFAGEDRRELVVTTGGDPARRDAGGGRVLRLPMDVPGRAVPLVTIPVGA